MRCSFMYEKNNTKLTVVSECDFEELAHEILTNSQLLELYIQNVVYVSLNTHFVIDDNLPKLRKLCVNKEGSRLPECSTWLIRTFSQSLCVVDCYSVIIPVGLRFPRLIYLRLSEGELCFPENARNLYPKLTHVYIPSFSIKFPSVDLVPPIAVHGNIHETEFCLNVFRNQKRELAALTLYWCVKQQYKCKDVARMLMIWVMRTANGFWKITKKDIPLQDNDKKIYFARFSQTLVDLKRHTSNIRIYTNLKRSIDKRVCENKRSIELKRGRTRNEIELLSAELSVKKIVKSIKKRKTNFIDD